MNSTRKVDGIQLPPMYQELKEKHHHFVLEDNVNEMPTELLKADVSFFFFLGCWNWILAPLKSYWSTSSSSISHLFLTFFYLLFFFSLVWFKLFKSYHCKLQGGGGGCGSLLFMEEDSPWTPSHVAFLYESSLPSFCLLYALIPSIILF